MKPDTSKKVTRDPSTRWTKKLVKDGWTPVSDAFLQRYSQLDPPISTAEAMFVIQLLFNKWDSKAPFPGFKTLGKRMGITHTQARNHARSLEKKGYLTREMRISQTNKFHLEPLFKKLESNIAKDPIKKKTKEVE